MDVFSLLSMLGGLSLLLYGMDLMGKSFERMAGSRLQAILERLTHRSSMAFLLGLTVTAVVQSSSAATVMVIGFVNSGLMKLRQACCVIMGVNVGTTITAWVLSLSSLEGSGWLLQMLKPAFFAPIFALIGAGMHLFSKRDRTKNIGSALLGFAILIFGMNAMSDAVEPLADSERFARLFTLFRNPFLGVLTGTLLTAILQSSSASVGVLQALSTSGAITYSSAFPIIMGQNIGTCATALISSLGANRSARRAAFIHLYFNVIGVAIFFSAYLLLRAAAPLAFADQTVTAVGIAAVHTLFNLLATIALLPFNRFLEKLACLSVPDRANEEPSVMLDERLLATPSVAVEQSRQSACRMSDSALRALNAALDLLERFDDLAFESVRRLEDQVDQWEDALGSYLVKLSLQNLSDGNNREIAALLHFIGDFERICDHAVNISESAKELHDKQLSFSDSARKELRVLSCAVREAAELSISAFVHGIDENAREIEPLEQVVDDLTMEIRRRHIDRLQSGETTIELGFILSDLLSNCERVADHCSNIAAAWIESAHGRFELHGYTGLVCKSPAFQSAYLRDLEKYRLDDAEN